ncbi:PDR/VanB family oxidoreductase [Cryobacterium luteum]|uniref:Oxidoreductase n=1 Tax=Cryobacterium luteum TaxID=1424661 RepID=A0A1H8K9U1_9MICO|nr:PDR/VanB family oxidoreductase [Cryobacterium luteum]TFB92374.1 oxidoreductase [Cryobacterium luteum]SEN89198.1 Ferredoxin-NADP reductase [Cryobacterium luteum]
MTGALLDLVVRGVTVAAPGIRSLAFEATDGGLLPAYVAGSHIVVHRAGRTNSYSLTGSGSNPSEYTISVLRQPGGAGGSLALHTLRVGDAVSVSRPRSAFAPIATARWHLLIAAGIGITPMISHLKAGRDWQRPTTLLYRYRPGAAAHLDEARALAGTALVESTGREHFTVVLAEHLRSQPLGTHLYVCGPVEFSANVLQAAADAGWPGSRLHSEPFAAADLGPGKPFRVHLARSDVDVDVPAGVSLLDALERADHVVPNMCRSGICGECIVPVLRGRPDHRDLYLSDDEKTENASMMCCVSRGLDHELELDL